MKAWLRVADWLHIPLQTVVGIEVYVPCLQSPNCLGLAASINHELMPFCLYRYQPPGSHEGLVEGLLVEGRLRMRIAELQAHRAAGRRTMTEV